MKILLATDGFPPSLAARDLLVRMVRPDHEVTVMSVAPSGLPSPETLPLMLDSLEARREAAQKISEQVADHLRDAGFTASAKWTEGGPARELLEHITSEGIDLTVVGSGRRSWLGARLLGSVSTHLLHSSESSVLVVHDAPGDASPLPVLVATDGSDDARQAAEQFAELVAPDKVTTTVLSAVPHLPTVLAGPPGAVATPTTDEAFEREIEGRAEQAAIEVRDLLKERGFKSWSETASGPASLTILERAEALEAALVVMGARGLGAFGRLLLGSTSDHVARHAPATLVTRSR